MSSSRKRFKRSANNMAALFYPVGQILPLNLKRPMENPQLYESDVQPVMKSSRKGVDFATLNRSLSWENQSNVINYTKDQPSFTNPCSAFQGLNFCNLLGSYLPSCYTRAIVCASPWHSKDADEAQSDGDDLNRQQQENSQPDRMPGGARSQSCSSLRAPTQCTDSSSDDRSRERGECGSSPRSVSAEAQSSHRRAPAEDHVGSGSHADYPVAPIDHRLYTDCNVASIDPHLQDRLPPERHHQGELSSNAVRRPSSGCRGRSSPQQSNDIEWRRDRDASRELLAASGHNVDYRREGASFTGCDDRLMLSPTLAVECRDGELEFGYPLCERADVVGASRFSDGTAGKDSGCELRRADAFWRSHGGAHGCSCHYFDDSCLSNAIRQPHPIEVVDDNLTQSPGNCQSVLPDGSVWHLMDWEETHDSIRHPLEAIDAEYLDYTEDEVTTRLNEGSVHLANFETSADGEHGFDDAGDGMSSVQAVDDAPEAVDDLTGNSWPSTL